MSENSDAVNWKHPTRNPRRASDNSYMESLLQKRVGERLATLGINAFEAARRGKLQRNFVDDIVNGKKRSVRGENLEQLATALECTPEFLISNLTVSAASRDDEYTPVAAYLNLADSKMVHYLSTRSIDLVPEPFPGLIGTLAMRVTGSGHAGQISEGDIIHYASDDKISPADFQADAYYMCNSSAGEGYVARVIQLKDSSTCDLSLLGGGLMLGVYVHVIQRIVALIPAIVANSMVRTIEFPASTVHEEPNPYELEKTDIVV